ncbi:MAG: hypothetical protein K6T80_04310 [Firmicutes bacterium]|nr:hypothetical protein [Bacillota bacterium]
MDVKNIKKGRFMACIPLIVFFLCCLGLYFVLYNLPGFKPLRSARPLPGFSAGDGGGAALFVDRKQYLCGDLEELYRGPVPRELEGLSRDELVLRYPPADGWRISAGGPRVLQVTRMVDDFCPVHAGYRHLGICHGMLAIYQGPLGCNEKLLRVETGLPLERLSADMQLNLRQAMEFGALAGEARQRLRGELEFSGEDALNAALENLDEHS